MLFHSRYGCVEFVTINHSAAPKLLTPETVLSNHLNQLAPIKLSLVGLYVSSAESLVIASQL
jgi:hypothetical protein